MPTSPVYDAIVIGGGPGGSTVATFLADAGRKVLLLEREAFPRYHIGESLLSGTMSLFEKLGVLDKIERAGHTKKFGISWIWGKDRQPWSVYFKDAIGIPYDHSFQVERADFDKILFENAREHGVEARDRHNVTGLVRQGERITGVRYENAEGAASEAASHWVVDASGQANFLSQQATKRIWDPHLRNMAIWSYWKGAERPEGLDAGNIFLPTFSEGWWWCIPLRNDISSIGAVIDRENFEKANKQGLKSFYLEAIDRTPELKARLKPAVQVDDIRVLRDWSYRYEAFCGKGYFTVGDAACFVDPLLSSGVHLAMLSGYLAAVSINTLLAGDFGETEIQSFYQEKYEREYSRFREKVYFLYGGNKAGPESYFWNARKIFDRPTEDPKTAFVSLIGGAFEHRAWYRRFSKQMELPDTIHEYGEKLFSKSSKSGLPLMRSPDWSEQEDFAVEGLKWIRARTLSSIDGRSLPLDEPMKKILALADGRLTYEEILARSKTGEGSADLDLRNRLREAVDFGLLK